MIETSTSISWPCRLKLGAKNKKDPHVRIVGKPDDVLKAKERVMTSLDSTVSYQNVIQIISTKFC